MKLAIDIDGVCARFAPEANAWLARTLRKPEVPIDRWDWFVHYGPNAEPAWKDLWRHIHSSEFMLHLDPEPYSVWGVASLVELGHEVTYLTARNPKLKEQTRKWLAKHDFPPAPLHMERRKHETTYDLYLDDHIDNVNALREADRRAVLFIQPWNVVHWLKDKTLLGVNDWPEFVAHVQETANA